MIYKREKITSTIFIQDMTRLSFKKLPLNLTLMNKIIMEAPSKLIGHRSTLITLRVNQPNKLLKSTNHGPLSLKPMPSPKLRSLNKKIQINTMKKKLYFTIRKPEGF